MFNILKYRKTKEDREKELKKLEKQTVKKMKKRLKEEQNYSEDQKKLLKKTKTIIFIYLTFLCSFFIVNLISGIVFAVVSAPLVYLGFRKKYPEHVKLFLMLSLCVSFCFLSLKGGDLLETRIKKKNYERQAAYNANLKEQLEYTQNVLDFLFELYELQENKEDTQSEVQDVNELKMETVNSEVGNE